MGVKDLLLYVPLFAALFWAAVEDVLSRRIRNALAFSLLAAGLVQSFLPYHTVTPWSSVTGLLAGGGVVFLLFALGGMGGGDVKLMAAVGAWIGPSAVINVFLVSAVFGLVVVLAQAVWQGRLKVLARNSAVLAINIAHVGELGVDHVAEVGGGTSSVEKPIPYAVSVLVGVAMVLAGLGFDLSGIL
jgi:prepilin peptidase CpaA